MHLSPVKPPPAPPGHLIKRTGAGTRAMGYNEYGGQKTDSLVAGGKTHLVIQKDGTWYTYGLDLIKNIWEVFNSSGMIATTYCYEPYGTVTAEEDVIQPLQWSSEYYDSELDLVYYNYRYYNPNEGRWINRDPETDILQKNLYLICGNNTINCSDKLGKLPQAAYRPMEGQDWMGILAVTWHAFVKFSDGSTDSNIGAEGHFVSSHTRYVTGKPVKDKAKSLTDGTPCECATDDQREKCVKDYLKAPHSIAGYPISNNCGSLVRDAFLSCCLEDPTPWWLWYPGGEM